MKKIIELLSAAEAEAKKLADENPNSATAQVLRARVLSALEITPHVMLDPKPEVKK
jgi:hypothetical protein